MIRVMRRTITIYGAVAAIVPKLYLAYNLWIWASLVMNIITITIYVFFWRAVYAETTSIAGLDLQATLNYILLAQIFAPLAEMYLVFDFGFDLREGGIAQALLRPIDFQGGYYAQYMASLATNLILNIPMALVVTIFFNLQWPSNPQAWLVFILSALLGRGILFAFDWMLACLTFYTTEVWGLGMLINGLNLFFSGGLIPLVMLPAWLQTLASSLPFAQALYVPLSLLTGITPLSQAGKMLLVQLGWLVALTLLSRLAFRVAVRRVTVQGG